MTANRSRAHLLKIRRNHLSNTFRAAREAYEAIRTTDDFAPTRRPTDLLKHWAPVWISTYFRARFGSVLPFARYPPGNTGIIRLSDPNEQDESVIVSMASDWGTGTQDAAAVGAGIAQGSPHFTIHLGDVYYVGSQTEVEKNMLGRGGTSWPRGSRGTFALNANHEMYARGTGYFQSLLPQLGPGPPGQQRGQTASYFALRNDHWILIGLDTGYHSIGTPIIEKIKSRSIHKRDSPRTRQPREVISWLEEVVGLGEDTQRGIILLTHHQYYSRFEDGYEATAVQLHPLVNRTVLWFWGHEHRLAFYGAGAVKGGITAIGRCIGHGGMPLEDINSKVRTGKSASQVKLVAYDKREREVLRYRVKKTVRPGQYSTRTKRCKVGFNGFVTLRFQGRRLKVEYWYVTRDRKKRRLLTECFEVTNEGQLRGGGVTSGAEANELLWGGSQWNDAQR